MIKLSAVRLAAVFVLGASAALADSPSIGMIAERTRAMAQMQRMCAVDAPSLQPAMLQVADEPAPDFTLNDLAGKPVRLSSLRGKVVLVDFWATWCGPCRAATPFMQELQEKFGAKGLVVLGVNQGESREDVAAYMASKSLTYRMVLDSERKASVPYRLEGIPTFVLVGADGKIIWRTVGFSSRSIPDFTAAVEKALSGSGKMKSI